MVKVQYKTVIGSGAIDGDVGMGIVLITIRDNVACLED